MEHENRIWATDDRSKSGKGHLYEIRGNNAFSVCGHRACEWGHLQAEIIGHCALCERKSQPKG
jgi:hypothetical protein